MIMNDAPMDAEEFLTWFGSYRDVCRWQTAKNGPPHEYTIKEWRPDATNDFEMAAAGIRRFGYPQAFYGSTFVYLDLDGQKYWTMGSSVSETTVLNRDSVLNRFDTPTMRSADVDR